MRVGTINRPRPQQLLGTPPRPGHGNAGDYEVASEEWPFGFHETRYPVPGNRWSNQRPIELRRGSEDWIPDSKGEYAAALPSDKVILITRGRARKVHLYVEIQSTATSSSP